jgi:integrase
MQSDMMRVTPQKRNALRISAKSKFDDDVWELDSSLSVKRHRSIIWSIRLAGGSRLTDPANRKWLLACKSFLYLYMVGHAGRGQRLRAQSVRAAFSYLSSLIDWMARRDLFSFTDLSDAHIVSYRNTLRRRKALKRSSRTAFIPGERSLSAGTKRNMLRALRFLVSLQDVIPDGPRISRDKIDALLGPEANFQPSDKKSKTKRIPDDLFLKLMVTSIAWIDTIGPALLARDSVFIAYRATSPIFTTYQTYAELYARERSIHHVPALVSIGNQSYDLARLERNPVKDWLVHLSTACFIVIAGLVGMRVSEILSLRLDSLSSREVAGGKRLLVLSGTLYKTSRLEDGEPGQWVAGWDEPNNPIQRAMETLTAIHKRHGEAAVDLPLFTPTREHLKDGTPSVSRTAIANRLERFTEFNALDNWHLAPHQFRKTFARFVTLRAPNAILALQRHFKHVSLQMTEHYIPVDPDLIDEIVEESLVLAEEKLDHLLGTDRLAGLKGEEILARNLPFRGKAGATGRRDLVASTMADPTTYVLFHVYGVCIYDAAKAKCLGDRLKVGLWTCISCKNLAIDASHLPFWSELEASLDGNVAEIANLGQSSSELEEQLVRVRRLIARLAS